MGKFEKLKSVTIVQHPLLLLLLLPVYFTIKDYSKLIDELSPFFLITVGGITASVLLLTAFVLYIFGFRNRYRAITAATAVLIPILFFGPIHDLLKSTVLPQVLTSYKVVVPVLGAGLFLFLLYVRHKPLQRLCSFFNTLLLILIFVEILSILNTKRQPVTKRLLDGDMQAVQEFKRGVPPDSLPDIFFLVFDSYTSSTSLQQTMGFNNAAADQFLEQKGFRIFEEALTNYNQTLFCVSSMFNMNYPQLPGSFIPGLTDFMYRANRSLSNNALFTILKESGYEIHEAHHLRFKINSKNELPGFFDIMKIHRYFYRTLPGRIYRDLGYLAVLNKNLRPLWVMLQKNECERLKSYCDNSVKKIQSVCNNDRQRAPQFLYAHFLLAHSPYCFNSTGELRNPEKVFLDSNIVRGYLEEISYANKIIKELVTYIQENNRKNSVIIIAGDHGFRSHSDDNMDKHIFRIRFAASNLNGRIQNWPDTISGVNIFRLVLNTYLGAEMPLLPHRSFFLRSKQPSGKQ